MLRQTDRKTGRREKEVRKEALNEVQVQSRGMPHFKSASEKLQATNEFLLLVQTLQGTHTLQTHWTLLKERRTEYSNTNSITCMQTDAQVCS